MIHNFSFDEISPDWTVFVAADHIMTVMRRDVGDFFVYCSCGDNWILDGGLCEDHLAEACRAHIVAKNTEKLFKAYPETLKKLIAAGELCAQVEASLKISELYPEARRDATKARKLIDEVLLTVHAEDPKGI